MTLGVRYRLLRDHNVDKVLYHVGDVVELPSQLGDGLVDQGAAERIEPLVAPLKSYRPARATPTAASAVPALLRPRQRACCGWGR